MSNVSKMFLRNITQIDMGVILPNGKLEGRSYNLSCNVIGELEEKEQVVVDFSSIKKAIKEMVDAKETGIDHKTVLFYNPDWYEVKALDDVNTFVQTPSISLIAPSNAFRTINVSDFVDLTESDEDICEIDILTKYLDKYLIDMLKPVYSNLISIECYLDQEIQACDCDNVISLFNYTHGLKNSSSWGCQNIAHGHTSWIEADISTDNEALQNEILEVVCQIADDINDVVFIQEKDIIEEDDYNLQVGYITERGEFWASYAKQDYNIIILPTDTTIENIVAAIWKHYGLEKYADVLHLYISEGLSKGAYI